MKQSQIRAVEIANQQGLSDLNLILNRDVEDLYIFKAKLAGCPVLYKFVQKTNQIRLKGYQKEVEVNHILEFAREVIPDFGLSWIKLLKSGEEKDCQWLIREYQSGINLAGSEVRKETHFYGYDRVEPRLRSQGSKIIDAIYLNLFELGKIKPKLVKMGYPQRYPRTIIPVSKESVESGIGLNLSVQATYLNKISQQLFYEENLSASSGDMLPANIIINENGVVFFTDFEWFSFDNYLSDAVFLWLFLHKYPDLQKVLISKVVKNKQDQDFFRALTIRQIIGWYNPVLRDADEPTKRFYTNFIWSSYLKSAAESFEAIINTK